MKNQIILMSLEVGLIAALLADWFILRPIEFITLASSTLNKKIKALNPKVRKKALKERYQKQIEAMI